jgi:hypothetical protein
MAAQQFSRPPKEEAVAITTRGNPKAVAITATPPAEEISVLLVVNHQKSYQIR